MSLPQLVLGQPGAILQNPTLALVFWGDTTSPSNGAFWTDHPDFVDAGVRFFIEFLRGYNADRLSQYGVGLAQIASISTISTVLSGSDPDFIADLLATAILAGQLPQPNQFPDTVYVFIPDPTSTIVTPGAAGQHWMASETGNFGFAGQLDFCFLFCLIPQASATQATTGVTGPDWWSNAQLYTSLLSHEIYETFTNPSASKDQGWTFTGPDPATVPPNQTSTSECCDVCDDRLNDGGVNELAYGPWTIDCYWSNLDQQCVLGFLSNWSNLSAPPGANAIPGGVALGQGAGPGALQVFAIDQAGTLWTLQGGLPSSNGMVFAGAQWIALATNAELLGGPPVAAFNPNEQLQEVFGIAATTPQTATGAQLWHIYQTAPSGGWSDGELLGKPQNCEIASNVSIAQNGPNPANGGFQALEAFVLGSDGQLHHIWQLGPWEGWSGWGDSLGAPPPGITPINSPLSGGNLGPGPCVATNADGHLEVFVLGTDNNIWHIWQLAPNSGWSGWSQLASGGAYPDDLQDAYGSLSCVRDVTGCLNLFAFTEGGQNVLYMFQTAPNNGWSPLQSLMPLNVSDALVFLGIPGAASTDQPPQTQLFTVASDSALWTIQGAGNVWPATPGSYQPWRFLGSPTSAQGTMIGLVMEQAPAAIGTIAGFTVCVLGNDGNVWSLSQAGPWNPWGPLKTFATMN